MKKKEVEIKTITKVGDLTGILGAKVTLKNEEVGTICIIEGEGVLLESGKFIPLTDYLKNSFSYKGSSDYSIVEVVYRENVLWESEDRKRLKELRKEKKEFFEQIEEKEAEVDSLKCDIFFLKRKISEIDEEINQLV